MKIFKNKIKNMRGITLISLVVTIIVLIILAGVTLNMLLGDNGILNRTKTARDENEKATATETINLKITTVQISKYAEEQRMPTLKELADNFCEDDDFQYVQETSEVASLTYITSENPTSIYTKLKAYPYEFEINSSLQLASIDGIKVSNIPENDGDSIASMTLSELIKLVEDKINARTAQNTMSGTEHFTGNYYLNGKPIYEKTIYISSLPNTNSKDYNHGIEDVDMIWVNPTNSFVLWSGGITTSPLNYTNPEGVKYGIGITSVGKTVFRVTTGNDRSKSSAYITLRYTKTTDTPTITTEITTTTAN